MIFKIKDNVDLKQLEKFGFEEYDKNAYFRDYNGNCYLECDEIRIREDRIIVNWTCLETEDDSYIGEGEIDEYTEYKIKDLIEAGLVEEVEE